MVELLPGKEKFFLPPAEGSKVCYFLLEMQGSSLLVGICIVLEWYLSESSSFRLPDSIVHKDSFLLIFTALSGIFFVNAIQTRFPLSVGRQAFFPLGLQAGSGTGSPRAPIQTRACS